MPVSLNARKVLTKLAGFTQIMKFDNRWQLLFDRLLFTRTRLNVYRRGEIEFIVDHAAGDASGVRDVLVSGMYRDLMRSLRLGPKISVIDLGASTGGFPLLLKHMGLNIDKLICVEMNPNTHSRLEFNIKYNFRSGTTCVNAAIWGREEIAHLCLGQGSTSDSVRDGEIASGQKGKREYRIRCVVFDEVFRYLFDDRESVVDLCKIDVEGAEYEMFLNDGHSCIKRCRYLLAEIHDIQDRSRNKALWEEIRACGFDVLAKSGAHSVYLMENRGLR